MAKPLVLTQESFETLLGWLDSDRDRAGQKYETIRRRLIRIFYGRGLTDAETLADETINRVADKVKEIAQNYRGDQALYFYGIAQKVCLEARRKKPEAAISTDPIYEPIFDEHTDHYHLRRNCLNRCLVKLSDDDRRIVIQYYASEDRTNVDHRHHLAEQLRLTANALRVRAHRIRQRLQKCVWECAEKNRAS